MSEYCKNCYELAEELHRYKQVIKEIKEIAKINVINTCWTFFNVCDDCEEKAEAGLQCPQTKLDHILQKCEEVNK